MTTRRAGLSCPGDALAVERRKQRLEALLSSLAIRLLSKCRFALCPLVIKTGPVV